MNFELALALLKTSDDAYFAMHREGKESYVYRFKGCFFEATKNYFNFYKAGSDDMNAEDWMVVGRRQLPVYVAAHLPLEPTDSLKNAAAKEIPVGDNKEDDTEDKRVDDSECAKDEESTEDKCCCGQHGEEGCKCGGDCKCNKRVKHIRRRNNDYWDDVVKAIKDRKPKVADKETKDMEDALRTLFTMFGTKVPSGKFNGSPFKMYFA